MLGGILRENTVVPFCFSALFFLCSCAPQSAVPSISQNDAQAEAQRQLAFRVENIINENQRVQTVGYRVLVANADVCKKTGAKFGFSFQNLHTLPRDLRPVAQERLGISEQITLTGVVPGSPADKAGLKSRDSITLFSGRRIPTGQRGASEFARLLTSAEPGQTVRVGIVRDGKRRTLSITPVRSCAYPIYLADQKDNNAFTDGRRIVINRGMLPVATSDEELALVVGHELAHITSGHLAKKATNKVAGTFGGLALDLAAAAAGVDTRGAFTRAGSDIGARAYSQAFEKEADYVGMYYVARAGYNTNGVEKFWRKMADVSAQSISFAGTHPSSAERFLVIRQTHKEIADKRNKRLALLPNQKAGN